MRHKKTQRFTCVVRTTVFRGLEKNFRLEADEDKTIKQVKEQIAQGRWAEAGEVAGLDALSHFRIPVADQVGMCARSCLRRCSGRAYCGWRAAAPA